MNSQRSSFTGKLGFVLAAAGSAVGLGNIWRFPYLAEKYGGGIFLFVYVALAVTFGFSLMIAEISIGRKTGLSAIGAFRALDKRFSFLGPLCAVIPIIILPYYSVIGGWVIKYLFGFVTGDALNMANDAYFGSFIGSSENWAGPLLWFALFIGITAVIVLFGVQKGIEKVSKVLMPVLIVFIFGISLYTIISQKAWDGVLYYITPDFRNFSPMVVVAAAGQLFYSMSLAMGIMITFGSYMKKDICIEKSVRQIEIFDTLVAFLAGLMIVPAVYVFQNAHPDSDISLSGPGLMFQTLPMIFRDIPGGAILGAAFFFMVLLAALTSSISLMETIVSIFQDKLKWGRKTSCFTVLGISLILGVPSVLGFNLWSDFTVLDMDLLTFFDYLSNSILMPIVSFITCIFVGYFLKPRTLIEEASVGGQFKSKGLFSVMIRYVAPVFLLAILVFSILDPFFHFI